MIHNLSMLTFSSAPPHHHHAQHPPQGLGKLQKSTFFFGGKKFNSNFSQIPKILCARFRCMMSFTPSGPIFYLGFLFWHLLPARTWTPAFMLHLTNPCAKCKVLSLTKPKARYIKRNPSGIILQEIWKGKTLGRSQFINHNNHLHKYLP